MQWREYYVPKHVLLLSVDIPFQDWTSRRTSKTKKVAL